jgi:hypothetical protein
MQPLHPDQELALSVARHRRDAAIAECRRATRDRPTPSPGASVNSSRRFRPGLLVARQHAREVGVAVTPTSY